MVKESNLTPDSMSGFPKRNIRVKGPLYGVLEMVLVISVETVKSAYRTVEYRNHLDHLN